MRYSILESEHGDIVASYDTIVEALRAVEAAIAAEPAAAGTMCVACFDGAGQLISSFVGEDLRTSAAELDELEAT